MKTKPMPLKTSVIATSIKTGDVVIYPSIRQCSERGGFEYSSVRNCLHGRQKSHAGFTFEAATPLRARKANGNIPKVAALRNRGLDNDAIAAKLGISPRTVPVYASQAVNMGLTKVWREILEDMELAGTKLA